MINIKDVREDIYACMNNVDDNFKSSTTGAIYWDVVLGFSPEYIRDICTGIAFSVIWRIKR